MGRKSAKNNASAPQAEPDVDGHRSLRDEQIEQIRGLANAKALKHGFWGNITRIQDADAYVNNRADKSGKDLLGKRIAIYEFKALEDGSYKAIHKFGHTPRTLLKGALKLCMAATLGAGITAASYEDKIGPAMDFASAKYTMITEAAASMQPDQDAPLVLSANNASSSLSNYINNKQDRINLGAAMKDPGKADHAAKDYVSTKTQNALPEMFEKACSGKTMNTSVQEVKEMLNGSPARCYDGSVGTTIALSKL